MLCDMRESVPLVFHLIIQYIVFIIAFLISRLVIIVLNVRRRRTAVPGSLLFTKRNCVRTLVVLGSGN